MTDERNVTMDQRKSAGFSLIEILVVIAIIGMLVGIGTAAVQNAMESGRVTKCQANLREISQAMTMYVQRNRNRWPRDETGIRFLLLLYNHRQISGKNAEVFLCPGTGDFNDLGASGETGSSYDDWENIDSADISYAGRDMESYPIRGGSMEEMIIASDDNEFGPNHKAVTNYAFADGSVHSYDLFLDGGDLLEQYPELEDEGVQIGSGSPVERFQVLRID
ncbi:MAG: type II secretion system protein [Planctomycetota bacterium]|nr:type II secretion system protein [Planctomycetota bacterium]